MIAHWPSGLKAKPGSITRQPGHLIDFMATFLDVAGAEYPKQIADRKIDPLMGKSLLPILQGKEREGHETLYFHYGADRALRQGPWKLVSAKLGRWELYNLDDDRTETNDLVKKHPARVTEMGQGMVPLGQGCGPAERSRTQSGKTQHQQAQLPQGYQQRERELREAAFGEK